MKKERSYPGVKKEGYWLRRRPATQAKHINILYVLARWHTSVAHENRQDRGERSVVGIPKTMDNDVMWVCNPLVQNGC